MSDVEDFGEEERAFLEDREEAWDISSLTQQCPIEPIPVSEYVPQDRSSLVPQPPLVIRAIVAANPQAPPPLVVAQDPMSESSSDQDIVDYIDLFRRLVINSPLQISDFVPYHAKHDPTRTCLLATVHDEDACTIWSLMWVPEGLYVYYNWDDNEDENEDVQCECCMVMQWKVRKPIQVSVFEGVTIQPTDVVVFKSMQPALGVRYETCPTLLLEPHEPVLVDDFDVLSNATYRQVFGSYLENNMVAENPVRRLFILWRDFKRTYYEDFDEDFKRKRPPLRRVDRRVPLPLLPTPVAPPRAPVSDLEVRAMIDEIAAELDM